MAITQLGNAVVGEIYDTYTGVDNPETSAFVQSGVAQRLATLDAEFTHNGKIVHVPFWNDLDHDAEPNISDDSETPATPLNVAAGEMIARKLFINQTWKAADLVNEIVQSNPMTRIKNRTDAYWQGAFERYIIACLVGVYGDNIANDNSDMVNDIAGSLNSDVSATTLFSREAMVNAAFTSGDKFDDYVAIAVHSMVYARMVKNDDIVFVKPSAGTMLIPTFLGRQVIVDDLLPHTDAAGTNPGDTAASYTSILFGRGVVGFGMGTPARPSFVKLEEMQGNGGGAEILGERKHWIIHPYGYAFGSVSIGGVSPSKAELAEAQQWNRVVASRKNIPLAYLITNG